MSQQDATEKNEVMQWAVKLLTTSLPRRETTGHGDQHFAAGRVQISTLTASAFISRRVKLLDTTRKRVTNAACYVSWTNLKLLIRSEEFWNIFPPRFSFVRFFLLPLRCGCKTRKRSAIRSCIFRGENTTPSFWVCFDCRRPTPRCDKRRPITISWIKIVRFRHKTDNCENILRKKRPFPRFKRLKKIIRLT